MKTHLSHIMPVWKACDILGEPVVHRIGASLLNLRQSASNKQFQHSVEPEMGALIEALFYRPEEMRPIDPLEDPTGSMRQEPSIPPHIAASWNRWLNTKALQLDKATLLAFLVPHSVQPSSAGHMGLFDCLVYALQGHNPASATGHYGPTPGSNNKNTIWVPDILILLAVCRQYARDRHNISRSEAEEDPKSERLFQQDQKIIWTMALLAYRIYDSYLKKGTVTRDTVHRFLTDVHGDDSYKKPHVKALLDVLFHPANDEPAPLSPLEAVITEAQFCRRCLDTMRPNGEHLLLDWIVTLVNSMAPTPSLPGSVAAYLETMNSTQPPLCQVYALADQRLYEIKRRFHSMVQEQLQHHTMLPSPLVIQGDPMTDSSSSINNNNMNNTAAAAANNPSLDTSQSGASAVAVSSSKVISEAAFCHFVTRSSEEMGFGGHLTTALAKWVFRAGCRTDAPTMLVQHNQGNGWGLFHVLQFGCIAVRLDTVKKEDLDVQLLRFLFGMFQLRPPASHSIMDESHCGWKCEDEDDGEEIDKRILTRQQISWMLLRLIEYAEFRVQADLSPFEHLDDVDDDENKKAVVPDTEDVEQTKLNLKTAVRLGLLAPPEGSNPSDCITLREIVDITLVETENQQHMTFDDFCTWSRHCVVDEMRGRCRLYPLMMELRLIASVQFGIPPTLASTEIAIIGEIDRRHRSRYPQSEVSRRGPRGTVWNIIDAVWSSSWKALVKKVAGTAEDNADGRGDPRNDRVRGLPRISNTGLLVENGSLSLRPDIRWHHDYELLPPLAWSALQAWYDGGPPIHRSVVKYVASSGATTSPHSSRETRIPTENEIELYPFFVTVYLCDAASRGEARPFQQNYQLSRVSPIMVMLVQLCRELDVDPDRARLWVMGGHSLSGFGSSYSSVGNDTVGPDDSRGEDWILDTDMNIVDQLKRRGIPKDDGKVLLLELKDKESGKWPRGVDGREWTFRDRSSSEHAPVDIGDGVVGLYNMGNTCYMSTSIQCLSHTPILREYFTSKAYYKDINKTNPLGYEGKLAQVSAVLINELWKRSNPAVPHQPKRITAPNSYSLLNNAPALTPKTFKESLGKFNDIFQGNEQHDAQELLAFLLGGLSEDLNRIMDKPYIEAPDSDGRPDHELADIWWSNHLKREMSIIVALFTGQYKSLLTCRTCKYESARFEPFTFLQLPLPEDEHLSISLIFYSVKEGAPPMRYCVRVKNDGALSDVLIALAKILHQDEIEERDDRQSSASPPISVQPSSTREEQEWEEMYLARAKNMSVVVMREGYIAKMAPGTWLLRDQQNKESGEIPLLHVYELDPIVKVEEGDVSHSDAHEDGKEALPRPASSVAHLAIAQRRSELVSRDFLHPLAHRVFGTPLLIRINDFDKVTGRDLYDFIAKRLKSVVPKSALRFLSSHQEDSIPASSSLEDARLRPIESNVNGRMESTTRTTTDMEEVAAGQVPRYGFRIRVTSRDGRRCLTCKWYECCIGCLVPDDDSPTIVEDGDSLVVDWHFAVDVATSGFGLRVSTGDAIFSNQPAPPRIRTPPITIRNHSSCGGMGQKRGNQAGAVTLEECLDAFAKEEKIPEAYCSKCKDFRVQTKRMSLWRLPPVMIIHLKRFQFTPTMRRKLRELVVFPIEGLDLSRIMAPSSTKENGSGGKYLEDGGEKSSEELKDDGRSEMLYDLYGVIHHQGALSGGHYVASIKSEIDGQWRLFNDAQIYEINARDVVDASAYILFYIRRDVSTAQLSDFWDVREGNGLSDEDMDQLLKGRSDRCVVS